MRAGCTAFVRRTMWEKPVDMDAAHARAAKQGPPRSVAAQGEVTHSPQQIHHVEHALGHIHQFEALVHGCLAQLFVRGLFG